MGTETLDVLLDAAHERAPVAIGLPTSRYVDMLERRGYEAIRLTGLAALRARGAGGVEIDAFQMPIDPDAQLLLDHVRALEELAAHRRTDRVWTYVADGCFEFNAALEGEVVHVRAGIFRGPAFAPPFADSVTIDLHAYVLMWRSVARSILDGAEGVAPGH